MSLGWVLALPACLAGAALLEQLTVRGIRAVQLSAAPLSGDHVDSVYYERSAWTPGERDNIVLWLALGTAGGALWASMLFDIRTALLAVPAWLAALGWDLWRWERAAASVKFVSWRRGWRQSARRVPVSRLASVDVHEKPVLGPLSVCSLRLTLDDGKVVKLPRTCSLGGLDRVEDVANFIRLQMQQVEELRRRRANEQRRQVGPRPDAAERELRERLKALRRTRPQATAAHH
ncbi:PH domain-containing protein [Caldimonas brevitalea]|uniref:PH domain-containing protein n=1 Tax=Caldimonas brevitalea TaxID=413882 RepID=A0A0G3BGC2_9BURK|nr:PH domain-containing protein [Caldimonas brevitalea]AKJ27018.1 hypothetical protein AAW51_0327 [Caldimonas brevitalea]